MNSKATIWISAAIAFLILIILVFLLPQKDRSLINVIGLVGFLLSVLAIVISYVQILSVKKNASEMERRIDDNVKQYHRISMISDLSKKGEIIYEIQGYLRDDRIDLCRSKMKDLKAVLASIETQHDYSSLVSKKEFKNVVANFQLDYRNILTYNLTTRNKIDKTIVIEHLEALSLLFLNVESQLKNQKHDTGKA